MINATTFICSRNAKHQVDVADQMYSCSLLAKRGIVFFFRKPSGRSISTLFHRHRKWNIEKNHVEQHRSIIGESPRRAHLSCSRSIGSLGHLHVCLECVHTTRSHHWDISSLSGKVNNLTRLRLLNRYHKQRTTTLDLNHTALDGWKVKQLADALKTNQVINTKTCCFPWISHFCSQCTSGSSSAEDAEKPNESRRNRISCRVIEG